MFKRDDYIGTKHDAGVFSKWQGFGRSMLLRGTLANYTSLSRHFGPKQILVGAEDFKKGTHVFGRYRVQRSIPGLYDLGVDSDDALVAETIRSQLRPYGTRHDLIQKEFISQRKPGLSPTIRPLLPRIIEKESEERLSRSRPQQISDRHDDIVDSASGCLEAGTACTVTPIKGQIISHVSPKKHIPCEAADICGVILPDMVPCRRKPVSRRKRCEDHKGMNQEDLGPGPCCEATTKNGLPCKRSATMGSRRCWQHNDKTLGQGSSENFQSATTSQGICGVKLYNGLPCENPPIKGRKRCEDHKGMRIVA